MVFDIQCQRMFQEPNGMSEFAGGMQNQRDIALCGIQWKK